MKKTLIALFLSLALVFSLSISTLAAPAGKPSVTKSEAPQIISIKAVNSKGNVVKALPFDVITITPVGDIASKDTPTDIAERLDNAYDQLSSIDSISDLPGQDVEATINEEYGDDAADNLAVRELFDIQFSEEAKEQIDEGNAITIVFDTNITDTDELVVLINYEGNKWKVIPASNIVLNADGTVSITFDEAVSGPIAFLVYDSVASTDTTPFDNGRCTCWLCNHIWPCICSLLCDNCINLAFCPCWILVILIVLIIVFVVIKLLKKKKDKKNK